MRAVLKTYDRAQISFAQTLLEEAGIGTTVLDGSLNCIEAMSWPAFQLVVLSDDDLERARDILRDGLADWNKVKV